MTQEENRLIFTNTVSDSLLDYFNGKDVNFIQEFCICAIHRLKQSAIALKVLISRAEENQSLEYACAILIRSVLSDGLHILNAIIICKDGNDEEFRKNLEVFCFSSLADSINHLIQNVRKSTNAENKEQIYKGVRDYYLRFLEPHGNAKGEPKVQERACNVSNSELAKRIKKDKDLGKYSFVYEAFLYYSKYEHFGCIYHDFQANGFHAQINKIKKLIIKLFPWLLTTTVAILRIENKEDVHVKHCYDDLISFCPE
jgi:hypothetical protein